jgi:hypothetical protein
MTKYRCFGKKQGKMLLIFMSSQFGSDWSITKYHICGILRSLKKLYLCLVKLNILSHLFKTYCMKKVFLSTLFLLCVIGYLNAQVYFEANFNDPDDLSLFTQYDADGLTPLFATAELFGVAPGPYKAWINQTDSRNNVNVAASTSYYIPAGQANDWLVSPAIQIPVGVTNAVVAWSAASWNSQWLDGYKVYISTTGNTIADFTGNPVFSVEEESVELTDRSVSLSQYSGQTIYIAWVNDSSDRYVLGITNIVVGVGAVEGNFIVTPDIPQYVLEDKVEIKGTVINSAGTISPFTAYYTVNGSNPVSQAFENTGTGSTYAFAFDKKVELALGEKVTYEVWVSVGGVESEKRTGTVARIAEQYTRKIVVEEATGTLYSFAPRGLVFRDSLNRKYPETFIGISVHNNDPMTDPEYDREIFTRLGEYPSGLINRIRKVNPTSFDALGVLEAEYINESRVKPTLVKISLSAQYTNETKTRITANIQSNFALNQVNADFSLSVVVTENNVTGTGPGYDQQNFYGLGVFGAMGGYENLPFPAVPADQMVYHDVARALFGTFAGFEESIPQTVFAGTPVNYTYAFDLPASVLNANNINIIAFIIDNATGEIINADRIKAGAITVATAIKEIQLTGLTVNAYKNSNGTVAVEVETESTKTVSISIYSLDGKKVAEIAPAAVNGFQQFEVTNSNLKGIYLIKVKAGQQIVTKKVVL